MSAVLLGIDAGGTHTDAVAVRGGRILAAAKTHTRPHDLLASIRDVLAKILTHVEPGDISRVHLSSTLTTNAVVGNTLEDVGVLVCGGPGIAPEEFRIGRHFYVIPGATDFRGAIIEPLDEAALKRAAQSCREHKLAAFAVAGKFSTRNAGQEMHMGAALPESAHISYGHKLSGRLNFPRRIATAYYNAAVWHRHNAFANAVTAALNEAGINAPVHILKADGGTMPLAVSRELPVETILSGPSASVMGAMALARPEGDAALLDIGGSTTDIALFADGSPVVDRNGIRVGGLPSLVQALHTRSIGIGGDSRIWRDENGIHVGPERLGPSHALGGGNGQAALSPVFSPASSPAPSTFPPTLTDALNLLGHAHIGDINASIAGINALAASWDMDARDLASKVVASAVGTIAHALNDLIEEINAHPVYTLRELLSGRGVNPARVHVVGGPAKALAPLLEPVLERPVDVPPHFSVANAVGAALAAATTELALYADTARGSLSIPTLGIERAVGKDYSLEEAKNDAVRELAKACAASGMNGGMGGVDGSADSGMNGGMASGPNGNADGGAPEITILEASSFNMIEGMRRTGRILRVRAALRPGLLECVQP